MAVVLGRAPGGTFSFETAPFKLTAEMVDCFGGKDSANYAHFIELCTTAAQAIRQHGRIAATVARPRSAAQPVEPVADQF